MGSYHGLPVLKSSSCTSPPQNDVFWARSNVCDPYNCQLLEASLFPIERGSDTQSKSCEQDDALPSHIWVPRQCWTSRGSGRFQVLCATSHAHHLPHSLLGCSEGAQRLCLLSLEMKYTKQFNLCSLAPHPISKC